MLKELREEYVDVSELEKARKIYLKLKRGDNSVLFGEDNLRYLVGLKLIIFEQQKT